MHFFKKISPKIKVMLSTGQWLPFQNVDNIWGIYPPEGQGISEWLTNEIRECIRAGRGGITEIDAKEYGELVQKKNNVPLPKLWREEMGKPAMQDTTAPAVNPGRPNPHVAAAANVLHNPTPKPKSVPERPTATRRKK